MAKKKAKKVTRTRRPALHDVEELATKLEAWANTDALTANEKTLLRWILSRCDSREIKIYEGSYRFKTDISQAVRDALAPLNVGEMPDPTEGWPRSGYYWTRSGYLGPVPT